MIPRIKVNYSPGELLGSLLQGRQVERLVQRLTEEIADDFPGYHVLLTPSGRGGLWLLLRAMGRRKVLMPAYTCSAVTEATVLAGCEPVYIRMVRDSLEMDLHDLKRHADGNAVIVATHLFGIPCRVDAIVDLARGAGSLVIEDVAAGLGGKLGGKPLGTFADAAIFSFDPTKTLHVPFKAGFLLVKEGELAARIREQGQAVAGWLGGVAGCKALMAAVAYLVLEWPLVYRWFYRVTFERHGRYSFEDGKLEEQPGPFYKGTLAGWQIALVRKQWARREQIYAVRREMFQAYHRRLREGEGRNWRLPPTEFSEAVCAKFCLRILGDKMRFYRQCAVRGVDMAFSFTRITAPKEQEEAHLLAAQMLNLPFYPKLTRTELDRVADTCQIAARELA